MSVLRGRRLPVVVGRWIVLLVALAGLMAMHGLSDHGVGAVAPVATEHASPHHADPPADQQGGQGDHHDTLVGLCLAVLVALLTFLLLLPRSGPSGVRRRRRPDLAVAAAVRARARGPSRPDLVVLSIARC